MAQSGFLGFASVKQNNETEIEEIADIPLPEKSSAQYESRYNKFIAWCNKRNISTYTEKVLLDYFTEMTDKYKLKGSSLCAQYSMIKPFILLKHGIDISKYIKLRTYVNLKYKDYIPKRHSLFTRDQINKFLTDAPDEKYLGTKVILIFVIHGECRSDDLVRLKNTDIQDLGSILYVQLWDKTRTFTIADELYLKIYRQYAALRPKDLAEKRFFVQHLNGKCNRSVVGVHTIGGVAKQVALYLKLKNWKEYNYRCLRQSSSSILRSNLVRRRRPTALNFQYSDKISLAQSPSNISSSCGSDSKEGIEKCSEEEESSIKTEKLDIWEEESCMDAPDSFANDSNGETENNFADEPSAAVDSTEMTHDSGTFTSSEQSNLVVDLYLKYVSECIKRFPLRSQAEIKMKIGNIIFKEEIKFLNLMNDAT